MSEQDIIHRYKYQLSPGTVSLLMTECDEVFDRLMDGTDSSEAVGSHLAVCSRCRDLQAILAPLVEMSGSDKAACASLDEQQVDSSFTWTDSTHAASPDSEKVARESAERLQTAHSSRLLKPTGNERSSFLTQRGGWRYVLAFCAGVAASLGVAAALRSEPMSGTQSFQSVCLWSSRNVEDPKSDDVVLTCVACHLAPSPSR